MLFEILLGGLSYKTFLQYCQTEVYCDVTSKKVRYSFETDKGESSIYECFLLLFFLMGHDHV